MPPEPVPFEQALTELERILRDLEDGDTNLEESLARYERGVALLGLCYGQLKNAEQKVRLLSGLNDDGTPDLKPFEHVASIETAKASVRKSRANSKESGIRE
ncbi:MAG TPA: exodeoxyribonuclease VII small subunit [Gemmataceae bacterium]|nr:exodeoxyribonuclease VII small subunit [Gemmataceae bacterium]